MAQNSEKRRCSRWTWVFGIVGSLVLLAAAGWFFLKKDLSSPTSKVKPLITDQLKTMITEASDSLYRVSYTRFDLNIDSGSGVIENFRLVPDSMVLKRLIAERRAPDNVLRYDVKKIQLSDFGFSGSGGSRKFTVQSVLLESPRLTITNKKRPYNDTSKWEKPQKLLKLLENIFTLARIENVSLKDLDFTFVNANAGTRRRTGLYNLDVTISGFTSRKAEEKGEKNKTVLQARSYRIATPDRLYSLVLDNIKLDLNTGTAAVSKAELLPRLGKTEFFESVGYAKDRFHLTYQGLFMQSIDFNRLFKKQELHIGTMTIGNAWAEVYTDLRYPKKSPPSRWFGSPHELLQTLAFDITIDRMNLLNADTYYRVLARNSGKTATLSVLNSRGTIRNITNNRSAIGENPLMTVNLQSKMMNTGTMTMKMRFNLTNTSYSYSSTMSRMPMAAFNPFSEALALVSVKSGTLNKMDVRVHASNKTAKGNINLYYDDMKVTMLKHDEQDDKLEKKGFLSLMSNTMLPNSNPTRDGKFRAGPINVERDSNMSFFGFMAKAMLDGMSTSMTGLEQQKEQPDDNIITGVAKAIVGPNEDREQKKRDRKEKRKEKKENKN